MEFRRPIEVLERRCPICGLQTSAGLAARCPEDGEFLVVPELLDQLLVDGRFRLVEPLGQGAFARVFAVSDRLVEQAAGLIALKLLRPAMRHHQEALARFEREGDLLGKLAGVRGVVDLIHRGRTGAGDPFLALEYVDGQTLQSVLKGYGHLPPRVACRIVLALLETLDAIHRLGIVHRDLKPSNLILLSAGDDVDLRLLDFGIAQAPDRSDRQLTMQHRTVGTPHYMSPELWNGSRVDLRSDLYATGVIMYYMLVGVQPFVGDTVQIANQHKTSPVPRLVTGGEVSSIMGDVIARAMSKLPEQRYASAEEMYDALAGGLDLPTLAEVRIARGGSTLIDLAPAAEQISPPISIPTASSSHRVAAGAIRPPHPDRRRVARAGLYAGAAGLLAAAIHTLGADPTDPPAAAVRSATSAPDGDGGGVEWVADGFAAIAAGGWTPGVATADLTAPAGAGAVEAPEPSDAPPARGAAPRCRSVTVEACAVVDPITGGCLETTRTRRRVCR